MSFAANTNKAPFQKWQKGDSTDYLQLLDPTGKPLAWIDSNGVASGALASGGAQVVQSGLIGQFKMLPTESVAALVDYSGQGNNATGTVGVAPTIVAGSGGVQFSGNGAVSLPAALNSARTIMVFAQFHSNDAPSVPLQSLVQGNDASFVGGIGKVCGLALYGGPSGVTSVWGNINIGGHNVRAFSPQNSNIYTNSSLNIFEGVGSVALVQDTTDLFYVNGVAIKNYFQSAFSSANGQTAGNYQLGGCAAGAGLQSTTTYLTGTIYYALFYNRVLTAAEMIQNHNVVASELANRGINVSVGGGNLQTTPGVLDLNPQIVFRGDSITGGKFGTRWVDVISPLGVGVAGFQKNNQGLAGDVLLSLGSSNTPSECDSLYRPGASVNIITAWMGVNDASGALSRTGYMRQFIADRKLKGWKVVPITVTSNSSEAFTNLYNEVLRTEIKADALCDINAHPNLGAVGAYLNATYFPDNLHPSSLANTAIIAPLVQRVLDRINGRNDWSAAQTVAQNAGPAFVQGVTFGGGAGTSVQINFTKDNLPGSTLFIAFDASAPTSVTDTNGNFWQLLTTQVSGGSIWYAQNVKGGLNGVVATFSGASFLRGQLAEYSGVSRSVAPQFAHANGVGTSLNSGNITTTVNGSLIIGAASSNNNGVGAYTPGASFVTDLAAGSTSAQYFEHQVQGVAGAIAATATRASAQWDMTVIALQPDTGATYPMQDQDVFLKADPTNGSLTLVLPPATGLTGQRVKIKNVQTSGANTVTVVPTFLSITNTVANGATAVFTVPNTVNLIAGQIIKVTGCTTAGLNTTYTITSVTSTTVTVSSAVVVTEAEPAAAQLISEFIDGSGSATIANNSSLILESVLGTNPAVRGCNWISVTD